MKQLLLFERILFYPCTVGWTVWMLVQLQESRPYTSVEFWLAMIGTLAFWVLPIAKPLWKWVYRPFLWGSLLWFVLMAGFYLILLLNHLSNQR